jgi:effector-binding domain-containing protein
MTTTSIEPRIVEIAPQPAVSIRVTLPMENLDLGALYGKSFPLVAQTVGEHGGVPAGAPFGLYHQWGPDLVDVEVGFPVAGPVDGLPSLADADPGAPGNSSLPGGRVVAATHRGPYSRLADFNAQLHSWIEAEGLEIAGGLWESYIDDPGKVPESEVRTEIFWPVAASR